METAATRLESLRRAAEAASGEMRRTADEIDDLLDVLPQRVTKAWKVGLGHQASRLRAAADSLTAEAAAGDPWTSSFAARIGKAALIASGGVLLAASQGIATGVAEHVLTSKNDAQAAVEVVIREADQCSASFADSIDAQIGMLRSMVRTRLRHPMFAADPRDEEDFRSTMGMLEGEDLGVPNARQRTEILASVVDRYGIGDTDVRELLEETRRAIEVLAPHEPSLFPPQPVTPPGGGLGSSPVGTRPLGT